MLQIGVTRKSPILVGRSFTPVFNRFLAKGIDVILILTLYYIGKSIWSPLGPTVAGIFAAAQDALGEGQSVGKRIMGLRVVEDGTGISISVFHSFMRNLPLVIAVGCAEIPVVWAFALFFAIPILLVEGYLVAYLDTGVRLADVMANTLVIEHFEAPDTRPPWEEN